MKRGLLSMIAFSFPFFMSYAATIVWDGEAADGLWSTAANWVGNVIPGEDDNVVLDNSVIAGSYIVYLPDGMTTVIISSLVITPSGNNTITLILPATNTSPDAFQANRDGDAVVLNSGAVFINSSGASGGTPVSVTGSNFFRINNGGRYIHRTERGHTNNLVARLSAEAGTERGIFEFDIPATTGAATISLSERTFGTLVLSSQAKEGPVTYSGNGTNPLTIRGDLVINTGVTFSLGLSGNTIVLGDYEQAPGAVFNLQNSNNSNLVSIKGNINAAGTITESGTGLPVFELNGTTNQNIAVAGNINNSVNFRINNPAGVTLITPVSLPYNLDLQNGKIKTGAANMLILTDDATVTGGSADSFVEGPMKKIGDDNFIFPVGKGSIYAPIGFSSAGMEATDAFEAEYFRLNPQAAFGTNYEAPIHHVSYVEYWQLNKTEGSPAIPANIIVSVTQYSFAKDINTLYVARNNFSQWQNTGISSRTTGPVYPPYATGNVASAAITAFGIFTLATSETEAINPLPVTITLFNAFRINSSKSGIEWQTADYYSGEVQFDVERSVNGSLFTGIGHLYASHSERSYSITDNDAGKKNIRYRLKIKNGNGTITYSNIVSLPDAAKSWEVSLYPNPSANDAVICIYALYNLNTAISVYDAGGRLLKQWKRAIHPGENRLPLQANTMTAGVYFISVNNENETRLLYFVKQ